LFAQRVVVESTLTRPSNLLSIELKPDFAERIAVDSTNRPKGVARTGRMRKFVVG